MANGKHGQNQSLGVHSEALLEQEVAARWRVSIRTVQRLRAQQDGPAFIQIGGSIRYRLEDILDYEQRQRRAGGIG
jgi:hypothetical protein